MSFLRLSFGALLVSMSMFALNANAATDQANQATASAAQATAAPAASAAATATATTKAHHARTAHHKAAAKTTVALVDINTATAAELVQVRGISKRNAEAIVAARSKNGNFKSVDDLKALTNAKGKPLFSEKGFARIEKRLTAEAATQTAAVNQ